MESFDYYLETVGEIGFVEQVTADVVSVLGLPGVKPDELVVFETGDVGQALFLSPEKVMVLLFEEANIKSGIRVARTGQSLSIPVGKELLGRLVNPLGHLLNQAKPFPRHLPRRFLSEKPPGISERTAVRQQLETGVAVVDVLLPLGYGQRELITGDRKTGKTAFLLQTVLNQVKEGTLCIWAAIGKKRAEIKQIEEFFVKNRVMDKIVIVAAGAEDATGLIYLAPYSAICLAEYFKEIGLNSLVVLDDLTVHAKFYRELSLLSERFPGRESYPVDVFFTHAAILERGGNFKHNGKEVSISILPIAETIEGDLSGYIQTNLMSMTDGHLFFDRDLFSKGRRPAINPFLSVTRVGRQTQSSLGRNINRELMSFLVSYQKLSSYLHFGAELTAETQTILARGERIIDFFNQSSAESISLPAAFFVLACLWLDFWKDQDRRNCKDSCTKMAGSYEKDSSLARKIDAMVKDSADFSSLTAKVKDYLFKTKV